MFFIFHLKFHSEWHSLLMTFWTVIFIFDKICIYLYWRKCNAESNKLIKTVGHRARFFLFNTPTFANHFWVGFETAIPGVWGYRTPAHRKLPKTSLKIEWRPVCVHAIWTRLMIAIACASCRMNANRSSINTYIYIFTHKVFKLLFNS